ncbi:MAG: hypothetical protein ABUT20_43630 [Bacteroidota bacterium]
MLLESMDKSKVTVSFSRKVGSSGIKKIKEYIEFLELNEGAPKRKVPKAVINKLADEITEAAWEKFKKAKGLK